MKAKKWIAAALACLMLGTCVACGTTGNGPVIDDGGNDGSNQGGNVTVGDGKLPSASNPAGDSTAHYVEGTLHKTSFDYEHGKPFVVNGETEYMIVVSGTSATVKAAAYINTHVGAATGTALPVYTLTDELADVISAADTAIVIGCDELFEKAGLVMPDPKTDDIGETGYYIRTVSNSAFIQANGDEGYQLGALAFLRAVVGYDMLGTDAYIYERDGSVLPDMELIERPDFDFRVGTDTGNRYGMGFTDNSIFMYVKGTQYHNVFHYLPPETYISTHPEWFSPRTKSEGYTSTSPGYGQLCFTARGDEAAWNEMVQELYNNFKPYVYANPTLSNITITHQDSSAVCTCDACAAEAAKYGGSHAAAMIKFINAVDDLLQADLEKDARENGTTKREVNIAFFAYLGYLDAPVTKNADGTYTAIDGIKTNEHVGVLIAPIRASYARSFYDEENEQFAENFISWSAVSDRIYSWIYETDFHYYFFPMPTWHHSAETMRFLKANGAVHCYSQSQWDNPTRTAFSFLKDYINSKVEFDVNVNVNDVIDKYFANYFLDAAEPMRQFFDEVEAWYEYLMATYPASISGGYYDEVQNAAYWPKRLLDGWMDLIDEAYKAIEKYEETDETLYKALKDRINVESIFPRYALITFYGGYMSDLTQQKKSFKEDAISLGFTHMNESTSGLLENLWTAWGI